MGFKDWIPAGGKGHALLEVTGNVGNAKGGRMYGRRRFRGRRFGKPSQRFWTASGNVFPQEVITLGAGGPQTLIGISPDLGQPTPTGASFQYDQKYKLIGCQGHIRVWSIPTQPDSVSPGADTGVGSYPRVLFYCWKVMNMTADSLQAQTAGNNDMDPTSTGDMQTVLQGDDVLNWGFVDVPTWRNVGNELLMTPWNSSGVPLATTPTTNLDYTYAKSSMGHRWWGYIPRPRIPKFGITLGRTRVLVLYTKYLTWSLNADSWALGGEATPGRAWPMLRLRWTKG